MAHLHWVRAGVAGEASKYLDVHVYEIENDARNVAAFAKMFNLASQPCSCNRAAYDAHLRYRSVN